MAKHIHQLKVTLDGRIVGILARGEDRRIWFEYDPGWLASGFNLAPLSMGFAPGAQLAKGDVFGGLHGAFSDSLPDGWGLLLMDREFKRRFDWNPGGITPLDRLAYIGSRAMGALEYAPVYEQEKIPDEVDLGALAKSAEAVLQGNEDDVLAQLRIQGGSPGGARPKVTVARSGATSTCLSGFQALPDGYTHWIVKFRSKDDPADMGRIERAYADMAALAGVLMPKADLIAVGDDQEREWCFAVERFDRIGRSGRRHVLSLAGLLYANFRLPCMDYDGILAAVGALTRDHSQVAQAFRLMVFNVLAHNRDDHAKNFAFVYCGEAGWRLSPAFDLTFSAGIGGEHATAIGGHGRPAREHVLMLGKKHRIAGAAQIVDEVRHAVAQWPAVAEQWGVTPASTAEVQAALAAIDLRFD